MDDKARSLILGFTPTDPSSSFSSSRPPFSGKLPYKPHAHLLYISAHDSLLAHMHGLDSQLMKLEPSKDLRHHSSVAEPVYTRLSNAENQARLINPLKSRTT